MERKKEKNTNNFAVRCVVRKQQLSFASGVFLERVTCIHTSDAPQMGVPHGAWISWDESSSPEKPKGHVFNTNCIFNASLLAFLINQRSCSPHLQSDVAFEGGLALQVLVAAASGAAPKGHAGGHVDELHFPRVLLLHVHQLLHGPAHAPRHHLVERHH